MCRCADVVAVNVEHKKLVCVGGLLQTDPQERTTGEVVSKEVGEERGAQGGVDRRSDNVTSVDVGLWSVLSSRSR